MRKFLFVLLAILVVVLVWNFEKDVSQGEIEVANQGTNGIEKKETQVQTEQETNIVAPISLEGKTVGFIGDSLIKGYGNEKGGFADYLRIELPNTTFIDASKSGSTITSNTGTDDIIMVNQIQNLKSNTAPDLILFDGGANDIMGYSLGFLNHDLQKQIGSLESGNDSVIVDLEKVMIQLKNDFPKAKFAYIQPFVLDDETISHLTEDENAKNEIKFRRDQFFTEVQKLCQKHEIEYLDLTKHFSGESGTYKQDDWIHINDAGYQLLTPVLLQKLQEMIQEKSYNALVIGNSITLEKGDIGMAATDKEHDYYYLMEQKLKQKYQQVHMNRVSAIDWEENRIISSRTDWINENLPESLVSNQDLVVFQLGDNCVPTESFEQSAAQLIEHVKRYSPNAKMIWVAMWFINEERLAIIPQICQKYEIEFVNITDLVTEEYQSYIGEKRTGVNGEDITSSTREEAFHPNNKGMQMIADRIWKILENQ